MKVVTITLALASCLLAARAHAALIVTLGPSDPTTTTPVTLSATRWFPRPIVQLVRTDFALNGYTIDMQVIVQSLPGPTFPAVITEITGSAYMGLLPEGTYTVQAQMLAIPVSGGPATPYDSGTGSFTVTPEPVTASLLAFGLFMIARCRLR